MPPTPNRRANLPRPDWNNMGWEYNPTELPVGAAPETTPQNSTGFTDPNTGIYYPNINPQAPDWQTSKSGWGPWAKKKKHSYGKEQAFDNLYNWSSNSMHLASPENFDLFFPGFFENMNAEGDASPYGMDENTRGQARELFRGLSGIGDDGSTTKGWVDQDRESFGAFRDSDLFREAQANIDELGGYQDSDVYRQIEDNLARIGTYRESDLFKENEAYTDSYNKFVTDRNARDTYGGAAGLAGQGLMSSSQADEMYDNSRLSLLGDLYKNRSHAEGAQNIFGAQNQQYQNHFGGAGNHFNTYTRMLQDRLGAAGQHFGAQNQFVGNMFANRGNLFQNIGRDYDRNQNMRWDSYMTPIRIQSQLAGGGPGPVDSGGFMTGFSDWWEEMKPFRDAAASGAGGGAGG